MEEFAEFAEAAGFHEFGKDFGGGVFGFGVEAVAFGDEEDIGAWEFGGELDFEDASVGELLQEFGMLAEGDFFFKLSGAAEDHAAFCSVVDFADDFEAFDGDAFLVGEEDLVDFVYDDEVGVVYGVEYAFAEVVEAGVG